MTASSFQHLRKAREVETEGCAYYDMHMRLEEGELDNFSTFSDRGASEKCIKERARWSIDHRPSAERAPSQVEVQAMCGHGDADTNTP